MHQEDKLSASARWSIEHQFLNQTDMEIPYTITYNVGIKQMDESTSKKSTSTEAEVGVRSKLQYASATYRLSNTRETSETHLTGVELTSSVERKLELKVPPGKKVFLWQLTCQHSDRRVSFPAFSVTNDPNPPAEVIQCSVTQDEQSKIDEGTLLRLRHKEKNQYLNTIKRFRWEAATLGDSRGTYFRIEWHSNGRHVRIVIDNPRYENYNCLYSSEQGGIYFDVSQNSGKQLWQMSIPNPVDGDSVTFRNKEWPAAGLLHHEGPDTNVYCMKRHNLDQWVLEGDPPAFRRLQQWGGCRPFR